MCQGVGMSTKRDDDAPGSIMASVESLPEWVRPPAGGFTTDHFLRMRDLPRRAELIDGALVFAAPQSKWHSAVVGLVAAELRRQAPEGIEPLHSMTVRLDERQAPAPDVLLVSAEAFHRAVPDHFFFLEDVTLVGEAILPDSEIRDRDVKPRRYAAAGIEHFWLVEQDGRDAVVHVHELDPVVKSYVLTGVHRDRLQVTVPFSIDIGLRDVFRRR